MSQYFITPPELQRIFSYVDHTVRTTLAYFHYLRDQIPTPTTLYFGCTFVLCIWATFALWLTSQHMQDVEEQWGEQLYMIKKEVLAEQESKWSIIEEQLSKIEGKETGRLRAELEVQGRVHEKQRLMLLTQNATIEGLGSSLANLNSNAAAQVSQNIDYQQQMANRVCDELSNFRKNLAEIVHNSAGWRRVRSRTS
ncbi:hypothetical protein HYPSUDRAFT_40866 [Hypholoma sublateritium FD-334 SS-4]|uniref:Uncharacterized protein n=1 Tax=Hypholoma sublateritium (strain FD-334 SS-4) TaxID=945553 RepID=A0A0D2L6C0_HYPSF|nr:hypothetical protein HYPSUDRAFT_40866 [Hypholoma sublateritium FD-334 SS-4]